MPTLKKALFLVTMGGSTQDAVRQTQIEAMKTVMLGDRIHDRANETEFVVFDEMTRGYENDENRAARTVRFTAQAYQLGLHFSE